MKRPDEKGTRRERALRAREARLAAQFKGLPLPTYIFRKVGGDFVLQHCNDAADAALNGAGRRRFVGMPITAIRPDMPELREELAQCLETRRPLRRERAYRYVSTGRLAHLVVHYGFAAPDLVVVHTDDVTELKSAERRFEELLKSAPDAAVIADGEGRVVMINAQGEKLFGYERGELTGQPLELLVPERLRARHAEHRAAFLAAPRVRAMGSGLTLFGRRRDGTEFPAEISLSPFETEEGRFVSTAVRDVSERFLTAKVLAERTRLLEMVFEHSLACVVLLDRDFNFIRVNQAYARACRRDVSDFPGRNHFERYPSDARATFEEVVRTKKVFQAVAHPFTFPDHAEWGETYWDWTLVPVVDASGEVELLLFSLNDVTERVRAERALRARVRQQSAVAALSQRAVGAAAGDVLLDEAAALVARTLEVEWAAVLETVSAGKALLVRSGAGWPPGTVVGSRLDAARESEVGSALGSAAPVVFGPGGASGVRVSALFAEHGAASGACLRIPGAEAPFGVLGAFVRSPREFSADDLTFLQAVANVLAGGMLTRKRRAVRASLLRRVLSAQDEERSRIARELHDQTGQSLTALRLGLEAIEGARTLKGARARAGELRATTEQALDELVRLARGLHPRVLDDLGLIDALARNAADYERLNGIRVELDARRLGSGRLPAPVEVALYRIAQEALTNAARHASPSRVRIVLDRGEQSAALIVADDGRGFDAAFVLAAHTHGSHMGLHSIRERARLLGGEAMIESREGNGTTIRVWVPLGGPEGGHAA